MQLSWVYVEMRMDDHFPDITCNWIAIPSPLWWRWLCSRSESGRFPSCRARYSHWFVSPAPAKIEVFKHTIDCAGIGHRV